MELAFRTKRLRTVCADQARAVEAFGQSAADSLRTRLADLRAVTVLSELPVGRPEVIEGDSPELRLQLSDDWVLVLGVSGPVPRTQSGNLDVSRVRRAMILEIRR